MKNLFVLLFVALVATAPARAALVYDGYATGPGGLSTPYPAVNPEVYKGLLELSGGVSGTFLVMSNDPDTLSHVGDSMTMHFYSYAEVQAGAPVRFTPAQYARAAYILDGYFNYQNVVQYYPSLRAVAEAWGNDALAGWNTQVWDIMSSTTCPVNIFGNGCPDGFNWQDLFAVASGGPGRDEYIIPLASQGLTLASGIVTIAPSVPLPPAAWLLGSGLIALVGISRRRK